MWVASGGRWCDKVVAQIGRFGPGSKATLEGGLFAFQLDHGPMFRSIGCPVFRIDGCFFHGSLRPSDAMGRKPISDLLRKGHKLVFDLRIDRIPEQLCLGANGCFASFMTICDQPFMHRAFDVCLSLRFEITIVKLSGDSCP